MFWMPVSGSRVTHSVAVRYGAASKPGVEIGTGSRARPLPAPRSSSPLITTSWHGGDDTATGGIGLAIAFSHAASISSTGRPMPTA